MSFIKEVFSGQKKFILILTIVSGLFAIYGVNIGIFNDFRITIISILIIFLIFILCSFYTYYEKNKENDEYYKIIHVKKRENALRMTTEPINAIKIGTLVLIYYIDQNSEEVIGCGKIIYIQEKGQVQVDVKIDENNEFYKKISESNSEIIPKIRINPYVNYKFFREVKK